MKTIIKVLSGVVIIFIIAIFGYKIYKASAVKTANTSNAAENSSEVSKDDPAIIKEYGNLCGEVKKVDNEIFTVAAQKIIKEGKGTMNQETGKMVKFKCNKDTKLIKRTIHSVSKSKAESKDGAGSLSDIKVDKSVNVWGKRGADGTIIAKTVVVMEFN